MDLSRLEHLFLADFRAVKPKCDLDRFDPILREILKKLAGIKGDYDIEFLLFESLDEEYDSCLDPGDVFRTVFRIIFSSGEVRYGYVQIAYGRTCEGCAEDSAYNFIIDTKVHLEDSLCRLLPEHVETSFYEPHLKIFTQRMYNRWLNSENYQ